MVKIGLWNNLPCDVIKLWCVKEIPSESFWWTIHKVCAYVIIADKSTYWIHHTWYEGFSSELKITPMDGVNIEFRGDTIIQNCIHEVIGNYFRHDVTHLLLVQILVIRALILGYDMCIQCANYWINLHLSLLENYLFSNVCINLLLGYLLSDFIRPIYDMNTV